MLTLLLLPCEFMVLIGIAIGLWFQSGMHERANEFRESIYVNILLVSLERSGFNFRRHAVCFGVFDQTGSRK